jgi:hypothetical protein
MITLKHYTGKALGIMEAGNYSASGEYTFDVTLTPFAGTTSPGSGAAYDIGARTTIKYSYTHGGATLHIQV